MGSIAAFGALDADALGSLADAIERESGPSAVVSLASTCATLWRGQVLRLDNGTGPHALKGKLDVLRQEAINGLTQKLDCEDLRSLLRSSPDLSGLGVDASDARIIASLYLHDLQDEAHGKSIRCECCSHSLRLPPISARGGCTHASGTCCRQTLLLLSLVVVWKAGDSRSMSSWASRQSTPSTSLGGGWVRCPPSS
jgi:hypothetical protein